MNFNNIVYNKSDGVAKITLSREEKANAINGKMWKEIGIAMKDAVSDAGVRVIVLTGSGEKAFSAGNDITDFFGSASGVVGVYETIAKSEKPIISAVNGLAYGAGFELVLATDISIAAEHATFSLKEANVGLIPPWGICMLPEIVGKKKAKELMLTCDVIDAREAERLGIVNKVVPKDKLEAATAELVQKILNVAPLAARDIKLGVDYDRRGKEYKEHFAQVASALAKLFTTEDFREGVTAFVQKRKPGFKGK